MPHILDIDKLLEIRPRNRIASVGLEFEGLWKRAPMTRGQPHGDSSVTIDTDGEKYAVIGEWVSPAMIPRGALNWIKGSWPTKWDPACCGFHVHMKFESDYWYSVLMDGPEFQDTMAAYLGKWAKKEGLPEDHPIWSRLNNENEYCQHQFWPNWQVNQDRKIYDRKVYGHRYTFVNYCWALHGTLEIRGLPMLPDADMTVRAFLHMLNITNCCLVLMTKREKAVNIKVDIDDMSMLEDVDYTNRIFL